jgi:hypothetical protein
MLGSSWVGFQGAAHLLSQVQDDRFHTSIKCHMEIFKLFFLAGLTMQAKQKRPAGMRLAFRNPGGAQPGKVMITAGAT